MTKELTNKLSKKVETLTQDKKPQTVFDLINYMKPEIARALPKHMDADRIARIAITTLRTNPKLQSCDTSSFMAALMQSAQLGLEPNTPLGQAYLIPYGGKVQFQIGYKGLIDLAYRSGQFKSIYAHEVHEKDDFEYEYGLEQKMIHKPALKDRGSVIGYYGVFHLQNGGHGFAFMSISDVEKHSEKYSQAVQKGWTSPWKTDFNEMAKKTVLKKVLKYAPLSIEMARNISADETVKTETSEDMYEIPSIDYIDVYEQNVEEDNAEEVSAKKEKDDFFNSKLKNTEKAGDAQG